MLQEIPLDLSDAPVPDRIQEFAREGLRRSRSIRCFDFVPSNFSLVYRVLRMFPPGKWCEWGSGMGINTGIAAHLGFDATGIEIDPHLAVAARELLDEFSLSATIVQGSYYEIAASADLYYVYCWPGQMAQVENHFHATASDSAKLLICHGESDIRCKVKGRVTPVSQLPTAP